MRRQPATHGPRSATRTPPTYDSAALDDRAVLLHRGPDGSELEIGPVATSRGPRWTRLESLLGLGLIAILFGGALVNSLANPGPQPTPTANTIVAPAKVERTPIRDSTVPARAQLRQVGESGGVVGRTGQTTATDTTSPDDWLLPRPNEGLETGLGTPLEATSGDICVVGWSLWAVPTHDVLVNAEGTMVLLGSGAFGATAAPVRLPGPPADGDWTLRLATAYPTESDKTRWSVKFFRVLVGGAPYETPVPPTPRPTAVPTPAITPAVACGTPVEASGPPLVSLVVPGQDPNPGTIGAFTWFAAVVPPADIHLEEGPTIPFEGDLELQIGGDVCATRWSISSMQFPQGESNLNEVNFGGAAAWTSFTSNRADNPIISQQNRIATKPVGLGRTLIRATLNFQGGNQAQVYWLLRIGAFETPPIRVVAPDGTAITPVVGCGVAVSTNENYYGEDCGPGSWPLLKDGPMLTVHEGDLIRLESPDWSVVYWGIRWAYQADVQEGGGEPPEVGNLGGHDSLEPGLIRWLVPPAGDWTVQFYLTHEEPNRQYSLPLHIRLRVPP